MVGFILGMQSWGSIPDEIFIDEAGETAETGVSNIVGGHSPPCASVSLWGVAAVSTGDKIVTGLSDKTSSVWYATTKIS